MKNDIPVRQGTGNVFADLGFPDAETRLLKAEIVGTIRDLIKAQGLSQTATAHKIGLKQPDVSRLLDGRVQGFSLERLIGFLILLGQKVTVESEPANENLTPQPRLVYDRVM